MKAIDKLLFNTLVKRQGVRLPGEGSLELVYESAQMIADNIYPPHWKVVFSSEEKEALPSLVKMVETFGQTDSDTAAARYAKWLAESRQGERLVFDGVGEVKGGNFRPSKELTAALAPESFKWHRMKRRSHIGVWFGLVLLVILVSVGVYFYNAGMLEKWVTFRSGKTAVQHVDSPVATATDGAAEMPAVADTPVTEAADGETIEGSADNNGATDETTTTQSAKVSDHGRFCLSVGVFTIAENADKTIAKDPLKIGMENYSRLDWRGRVLVYAFSSDDRAEINRLYAKYVNVYSDIAVFDTEE